MATKPGTPTPWASNTNYSGGPAVGTATKVAVPSSVQQNGWEPDQKPPAQWENYWHNEIYQWCLWVDGGTSSWAETAHIVETDANGETELASLSVGPSSSTGTVLEVEGPTSGTLPAATVTSQTASGNEALMVFASGTGSTAGAISGEGGEGGGTGVVGIGGGDGIGVEGTGGSTGSGGRGAEFTGNGAGDGVYGVSAGTGLGGVFLGGSSTTSHGAKGTAGHADAYGLYGVSHASGNFVGAGVYGEGNNNAPGVVGYADDYYGVVAASDTSSPTRAALRIIPQDDEPTIANAGDVFYHDGNDTLFVRTGSTWRQVWATRGGIVREYDTNRSSLNTTSSTMQVVCATSCTTRRATDALCIECNFEMGSGNTGSTFEYDVYDLTDTTVVIGPETCYVSGALEARHVIDKADYTPGDTATHTYQLRYRATDGSTTSYITNASLEVRGSYPV